MPFEETFAAFRRGDNDEALRLAQLDLEASTTTGDRAGRVNALCMLSRVAFRDGRMEDVGTYASQALEIAVAGSDKKLERMPIHLQAVAARMTGQYDKARALYMQSIGLNEEFDETLMAAVEHRNLAFVEMRSGDAERAIALIEEAHSRLAGLEHSGLEPYLQFDLAVEAFLRGDVASAASKLAEAERMFDDSGTVPDPDDAFEMADLRTWLSGAEPPFPSHP